MKNNKPLTREEVLALGGDESPSNEYADVSFTYPCLVYIKVPKEIIEFEPEIDDEELAAWIEENIPEASGTDVDEIRIMDIL